MRITTISYKHVVRRSGDYQAAESEMSIEVSLDAEDDAKEAYERARRFVRARVAEDAEQGLAEYIEAAAQRERDKVSALRAANERAVAVAKAARIA